MRVCSLDAVDDFLAECFLGVGCSPEDTAGHFLCENDCETGADAGAGGDEDDGFEERGDAEDAAGGDAADVDVCWGALDGAACEVACSADDEGEAFLTVGIGDCCEAVPVGYS
jgi:hypothetical protein